MGWSVAIRLRAAYGASPEGCCELFASFVDQGGVPSLRVIVSDVIGEFLACNAAVLVRHHLKLSFDDSKTRLHEVVMTTVVGPVHTLGHASAGEYFALLGTCITIASLRCIDSFLACNGRPSPAQSIHARTPGTCQYKSTVELQNCSSKRKASHWSELASVSLVYSIVDFSTPNSHVLRHCVPSSASRVMKLFNS